MQAYQVIAQRVNEIGMTKAELARRVGMDDELLRRSLAGARKITSEEFICLCRELGLKLTDFEGYKSRKKTWGNRTRT